MNILGLARHGLNGFEQVAVVAVLLVAVISLIYAWYLRGTVLRRSMGSQKMQEVWNAIRIGANSYLGRQLRTILPAIALLAVALFLSVYVVRPSQEAVTEFPQNTQIIIAIGRMLAFVLGASFSLLVGQLGMRMAIQANVRSAAAAQRGSLSDSLSIAYYAGTITGMLTDGLGLLGGTTIFIIFGKAAPEALLGFGFRSGVPSPLSWALHSRCWLASWVCAWPFRPTCVLLPPRVEGLMRRCPSPITPARLRAC